MLRFAVAVLSVLRLRRYRRQRPLARSNSTTTPARLSLTTSRATRRAPHWSTTAWQTRSRA
eukprot:9374474-Lingulodinium_polyedra.AAC.1